MLNLESDRLNSIEVIGWGDLEGDGLDLIDWDVDWHGVLVKVILGLGLHKVAGSWSSSVHWGGLLLSLHEGSWSMLVVMLLSLLVVVLLVSFMGLFN